MRYLPQFAWHSDAEELIYWIALFSSPLPIFCSISQSINVEIENWMNDTELGSSNKYENWVLFVWETKRNAQQSSWNVKISNHYLIDWFMETAEMKSSNQSIDRLNVTQTEQPEYV